VNAAEHLAEAIDVGCTRDDHDHIGDHRLEVIAERDAQIIAWLEKKAGEEGGSNKERRARAAAIACMADKLSRGAVRPPLSRGPDMSAEDTLSAVRTALQADDIPRVRRLVTDHYADERGAS
jgi:hypothetical protein